MDSGAILLRTGITCTDCTVITYTQHTKSPKGLTNHWTEVDWTGRDSRKCQKYVNQPPEAKLSICTRRVADNNRSHHNGIGLMGCCVNPCCHSGLASVTGRE